MKKLLEKGLATTFENEDIDGDAIAFNTDNDFYVIIEALNIKPHQKNIVI